MISTVGYIAARGLVDGMDIAGGWLGIAGQSRIFEVMAIRGPDGLGGIRVSARIDHRYHSLRSIRAPTRDTGQSGPDATRGQGSRRGRCRDRIAGELIRKGLFSSSPRVGAQSRDPKAIRSRRADRGSPGCVGHGLSQQGRDHSQRRLTLHWRRAGLAEFCPGSR
jgi:hypothetical protein